MSATRLAVAVLLTAAILAVGDVVAAFGHPLGDVVADVDVVVGVLAAAALHFAVAPVVLLGALAAVALWHRAGGRLRLALLLAPTVATFAIACVLNRELLAHRPAAWVLVAGLPLVHGGIVAALVHPRWRRIAIAGGGLVALALVLVDAFAFRGVSAPQHVTLVLGAWAFAVPTIHAAARPLASVALRNPRAWRRLGVLVAAAVVVFVVQSFVALADAPAGARLVLRETAPAARATMDGLGPLFELDGDGDPGWPIGGDCAPFDGAVAPSAREQAGDGIDQNCLAGDPATADVSALRARLASSAPSSPRGPAVTRILLITIDALRHDAALPEMEARIGRRCTKVDRAYSTNNETTFAAYSLFASRFPSQGVFTSIGPYSAPIDDPAPRLPGLLGDAGFTTMAFAFHNRFDPRLGLTTGFADVWMTEATPQAIFA
ncbi:MAG TPA: hypothetical protein VFG69_13305, partial [Nannocystaceae bacterium]|nr:hypothetical protein [Nannocystaceae bacterium]